MSHHHKDEISNLMNRQQNQYRAYSQNPQMFYNQTMISPQKKQVQTELLLQTNNEQQILIQYYVYQDFQNLINLLYSLEAVKNYFQNQPNHPLITLSRNKIILQLNISNTIHYDQYVSHKSSSNIKTLNDQKENVQKMIKNIKLDLDFECQNYLDSYQENSLKQIVTINQIQQQKSFQNYNFNQNILQSIIPQISIVDQRIQLLRQSKQSYIPSESEVKQKAKEYQQLTLNKLSINYPNFKDKTELSHQEDSLSSYINDQSQSKYNQHLSQSAVMSSHFLNNNKKKF
ncbi:unnamed protein product [Paramecium sonneborni]|uniref:Uncharacterized protein n=1 Tax=Paramecium sonneborni TaxID=65129 RepID=A0A8S1R8F7_9CILI|nr:unnamed protein product [Paramecium sonneborni]